MRLFSLTRYVAGIVLASCAIASASGGSGSNRQLTASPTNLNFGNVNVGASSTLTVTATNSGGSNVNIRQATLIGSGFTLAAPQLPMSLGSGQSAQFTVTFTASVAGSASGTLSIGSNAPNSPIQVSLTASGVTVSGTSGTGQLTPNPTSLIFSSVTVGTTSTLPVIISNTGTASATISQDSLTGSGFSVSGLPVPVSLAPGQSVSMSVSFAPTSAGNATGQVAITGTASATVPLSATAVSAYGQLTPSPTSLNFGNVNVGASSTPLAVAVSNTGTGSATISQASVTGSGFSVSGLTLPLTLSPGQTTSFSVLFVPSTSGTVNGSLSLASTAANSPTTVSLAGSGVTAYGQLATNATTVNFGTVTLGTSSVAPVIVSNTGTGSATISQANLTGSNFSITGLTLPLTLSPGQNTSFSVGFSPTATGTSTGAVSLVSNASNSPTTVNLTGTGANQHLVDLSWVASTSTVSGYNIYRSSTSAGPYTRINSSLNSATAYTDSTVQAGQTYYYVTTAVNSSGAESPYSNTVQAIVPSP